MNIPKIKPVGHESISQTVYGALRSEIVTLKRPPGSPLSDKEISSELGVSRTPVREAIIRLVEEEMVLVRPKSGTFVALIRPKLLYNAHFLRKAIETSAIAEVEKVDKKTIGSLYNNLGCQEKSLSLGDHGRFYSLDETFHRMLLDVSGHGEAWYTIQRVKAQLDRVRYLAIADRARMEKVLHQHTSIVDSLARGAGKEAQIALTKHLHDSFATIERAIDAYSNYFESSEK
ncbi:GntR family transcriptional regulator [Salinicola peritrichatus]|uniref:GntR family transcriptional regulator n=1 Tax=Salinicola peritrichatus TaxID=1267424 RepID=UPI000DA1A974|nr:GntR family transcriptional regulator [Salinicola peritrichatus]